MSQRIIHNNNNCFNNANSFNNVWNNCTVADDRSSLLTWLSPLEPKVRHRDIQERRVDCVGEWLIQTEEFRSMAGVGKEITQSYFAMEIRGSARHLSGNKNCSRGSEERASANKPRCQFLGSGQVV